MMRVFLRFAALLPLGICVSWAAGKSGRDLYGTYCVTCHLKDGSGSNGAADLRAKLKHGSDLGTIERVIQYGVPGTTMPPFSDLKPAQREALARYVLLLNRHGMKNAK